jgi:hypothetical protein
MARYKYIDTSLRLLAVDLQRQLTPGTIEHALNHLLDHEMVGLRRCVFSSSCRYAVLWGRFPANAPVPLAAM